MLTLVCQLSMRRGPALPNAILLIDILETSWNCFSTEKPVILCLGLGSPTLSHVARVQLAFLAETCQQMKVVCILYYHSASPSIALPRTPSPQKKKFLFFFFFSLPLPPPYLFGQNHQDVSIYDPIFTKEDHLLFEELNMKVLSIVGTAATKSCVRIIFFELLNAKIDACEKKNYLS